MGAKTRVLMPLQALQTSRSITQTTHEPSRTPQSPADLQRTDQSTMPFLGSGPQLHSASSLDFFDSLPQLEDGASSGSTQQPPQSFFEGLAQLKEPSAGSAARQLYRLVLIDEESGRPAAYPSDDDLFSLIQRGGLSRTVSAAAAAAAAASGGAGAASGGATPRAARAAQQAAAAAAAAGAGAAALDPHRERSFQEILAETVQKKGGPVCDHCSATESPQWRRGPPHKPVLCNACGTRYRRTNQLGPAVPSHLRKRSAQQHCGGQALKQQGGPVAKQPRISVA